MNFLHLLGAWIVANPAISMPVIGALITFFYKPRTDAEHVALATKNPMWFFSRLAAVLHLVGAIFPDVASARAHIFKLIYGISLPKDPSGPSGPSALPVLLLGFALIVGTSSCTQGQVINSALLFAEKVQCALANDDLSIDKLLVKCAIEPGDEQRIIAIVGQHRAAVSRASYSAKTGCSK